MGFDMWGYHFEGAFQNAWDLPADEGVYVIWCKNGDRWKIIDVGESENVRVRILNHDRSDCWQRNCSGTIYYSATYTTTWNGARRSIEKTIRNRTNPPCGKAQKQRNRPKKLNDI